MICKSIFQAWLRDLYGAHTQGTVRPDGIYSSEGTCMFASATHTLNHTPESPLGGCLEKLLKHNQIEFTQVHKAPAGVSCGDLKARSQPFVVRAGSAALYRSRIYANPMIALDGAQTDTPGKLKRKQCIGITTDLNRVGFDGNGSFQSVGRGLSAAFDVLGRHNIEIGEILHSWLLHGDSGVRQIELAHKTSDPFAPVPIRNAQLSFAWYRRQSGNFEITAYVSC